MSLLEAFTFLSFWALGLGLSKLEQSQISISTEVKKSVDIYCKVSSTNFENDIIHWYRQKSNQALEHLIYVSSTKSPARSNQGGKNNKIEARKNSPSLTSMLTINFIEKEDVAIYYCAGWTRGKKTLGDGTKLVITERSLDSSDIAPKPTIFLPSVAEINLHKAGTYLCLLEKFFPDVIKVYWKEKDGNAILASQQGNTMKTKDTYMKFSWLTVTAKSMDKEHKCIVKHENNERGVDKEILFPSINKGDLTEVVRIQDHEPRSAKNKSLESEKEVAGINSTIDDCLKDKGDLLQLQLTNTSAYYTYILLLLKSLVYFAIIFFCLFRRTAVCGHGKSS